MIWFGKLLLAVTLAGPVPDGLADRVRSALARDWGVEAPVVRLQWGTMPIRAPLRSEMPFRLAGRGLDGRYVLLVTTDKGELAVSLRAGIEDSTWVASRPLAADVRLGADDMKREIRTMWGPGSRDDREAPLGWETRRAVRPGERLAGSAIAPPSLVAPGEVVQFEWNAGTISIVREGVAIGRGRLGETIQGRDKNGGERLTGIVIGPGRARLERGEIR